MYRTDAELNNLLNFILKSICNCVIVLEIDDENIFNRDVKKCNLSQ